MNSNQENIELLLQKREWQTFECKRAAVQPRKILEAIDAFANTEGGIVVLGLEDPEKADGPARLLGISEHPDNVSEVLKLIDKEIEPPLQATKIVELPIQNGAQQGDKLLVIIVHKSNDIHSLKNGDTFIRNGSQNVKIGSAQIIRLKYEKGVTKYESEPSKMKDWELIDKELFDRFKQETGSRNGNDWQLLKDNGLALKTAEDFEFTQGGLLLFAKNPAVALGAKCSIKISHYHGVDRNFTGEPNFVRRPFSIEGPLYHQITKTVDYFRETVRSSPPKLSGATFKPTLLVPEWVFQEAIANAVIHRNYSVQDDIHVRFFDDRIEIESPGTYPGHITPSNIRQERFARNPLILRTLNRFSDAPNLDHGEGVDRMFAVMLENNLYEPIYWPPSTRQNSVTVSLLNTQRIAFWDTVNQYCEKHTYITNETARKITGINDTLKMSKLLSTWVKQGLLEKTGEKRHTVYSKSSANKLENLFSLSIDNKNKNSK